MQLLITNPIVDAYGGSDLFGKMIFLSLLLLSIITWIIFLQKFLIQRNAKQRGHAFQSVFQKKRLNPLSLESRDIHPYAILYQTLKHHTLELLGKNKAFIETENVTLSASDIDLIEAHLMSAISTQAKKMEKNLFVLSTVVSLAPFLGLLGTVWGILLTFNELQTGASVNANSAIMGGLAMALGTTVAGLLVAIPALIGYNYLRAAITQFSGEMEDFSHLLVASVELQYRQVEVS
ncbi:MAG: MotA/TolQ/ExbB proton channel family protein [Chlamydiales bacterium]|nr:MotA/TolQ/ExbB proton channel family protein [Chlamydiales bacterium]